MLQPISITAIASISPLGSAPEVIWDLYQKELHRITLASFSGQETPVARLPEEALTAIDALRNEHPHYEPLDPSVLYGLFAARKAVKAAGWTTGNNFGINIGSSRGATELFEKYHAQFLATQKAATLSSPTTTLGNISSWVAQDLRVQGPVISHSITCSTALHSVLNGVAWIQSGLADRFMVGGSEAPLTPFTIAQMKALKIYAAPTASAYPCEALALDKTRNAMFLGEGAAVACLEKGVSPDAKALITGIGYATEPLKHNISISTNADCFQQSMRMALGRLPLEAVDVIVMHAPGTIKGDQAEYNAVQAVFGATMPALTTNKWKIGHTFGASGMLSLELAMLMIQHQQFIPVPYLQDQKLPNEIKNIVINAVGFGGNAVSILISAPAQK